MARFFEVLAVNSAGIVADATIYETAGVDRKTAVAYERLLSNLYVVDAVPAWLPNRLSRLVKTPKRYINDPSLVGAALRADVASVLRDGDLMGRLLDTFVAAQGTSVCRCYGQHRTTGESRPLGERRRTGGERAEAGGCGWAST